MLPSVFVRLSLLGVATLSCTPANGTSTDPQGEGSNEAASPAPSTAVEIGVPAPSGQPDLPLPKGAVARLGSALIPLSDTLVAIDVAADGTIFTHGFYGSIFAWDPKTGFPIRQLSGREEKDGYKPGGGAMQVSADGTRLYLVEDGRLRARDAITGTVLWTVSRPDDDQWNELGLTANGKTLLATGLLYGGAWIVDAGSGSESPAPGDTSRAGSISGESPVATGTISADGQRFVVAGKNVVQVIDRGGALLVSLELPWGTPTSSAFSPDGKYIAVGKYSGEWRIADMAKKAWIYTSTEAEAERDDRGSIVGLKWSPDSRNLAVTSESLTRVVSASGKLLHEIPHPHHSFQFGQSVAWSADGKMLYLAGEPTEPLRVELATGAVATSPLSRHDARIASAAFSPDGKWVATGVEWGNPGEIRVWDAASGAPAYSLVAPERMNTRALGMSATHLFAYGDRLDVWELETKQRVASVPTKRGAKLVVRADGSAVGAGYDGELVGIAPDGNIRWSKQGLAINQSLVLSPDGAEVALGGDPGVLIFDAATGEKRREIALPGANFFARGWNKAGVVGPDGNGKVIVAGAKSGAIEVGNAWVLAIRDDAVMAVHEGVVQRWSLATGKVEATYVGHAEEPDVIEFSPDGKHVLTTGSDTTGLIWKLP